MDHEYAGYISQAQGDTLFRNVQHIAATTFSIKIFKPAIGPVIAVVRVTLAIFKWILRYELW